MSVPPASMCAPAHTFLFFSLLLLFVVFVFVFVFTVWEALCMVGRCDFPELHLQPTVILNF